MHTALGMLMSSKNLNLSRCLAPSHLSVLVFLNDGRWLRDLPSQNMPFDEVRQRHFQLVADELLSRNREDLCRTSVGHFRVTLSRYMRRETQGTGTHGLSPPV